MRQILDAAVEAARSGLTELDISDTGCAGCAAPALTTLIREGAALTRLGASGLQMPSRYWAESFLPTLAQSSELVALDISHNRLTAAGVGPLLKCLSVLKLSMVDITACDFPDDVIAQLVTGLEGASETIQVLLLDVATGKRIGDEIKARKKAAKKDGGVPADVGKTPPLIMRPGDSSESGAHGLNLDFVCGTDVLRPAPKLLSAPDTSTTRNRHYAEESHGFLGTINLKDGDAAAATRRGSVDTSDGGAHPWAGLVPGAPLPRKSHVSPAVENLILTGGGARRKQPLLPWEGTSLARAVEREMRDIASAATEFRDGRPPTSKAMNDAWAGSYGEGLELALQARRPTDSDS